MPIFVRLIFDAQQPRQWDSNFIFEYGFQQGKGISRLMANIKNLPTVTLAAMQSANLVIAICVSEAALCQYRFP
jgi:hypothetical protein